MSINTHEWVMYIHLYICSIPILEATVRIWISHVTYRCIIYLYERVMSHMDESCPTRMNCIPINKLCHIWMNHTPMKETMSHMYELHIRPEATVRIWISHVTYGWTIYLWISHVTYGWTIYLWISHFTYGWTIYLWISHVTYGCTLSLWISHVTHGWVSTHMV